MAAPKENKFWMMRAKHGKAKIFKSPKAMWEAACEYFDYCEANPIQYEEIHSGKRMKIKKVQAFTIIGLCGFFGVNRRYLDDFERTCTDEFKVVIQTIRDTIYQQKFINAAAGGLNPMIIARDLQLREKTDIDATTNGESINNSPLKDFTFEQLIQLKYGKTPANDS